MTIAAPPRRGHSRFFLSNLWIRLQLGYAFLDRVYIFCQVLIEISKRHGTWRRANVNLKNALPCFLINVGVKADSGTFPHDNTLLSDNQQSALLELVTV